jgi:transglutaminase-like putative cysteine protease/tetratricopeptide (TPR) repeat protein
LRICRTGFRALLFLGFFGSVLINSRAAGEPRVYDLPHFSADPKTLYVAASEVAAPAGADAALLTDEESYVFTDGGHAVHVQYTIYKVLSQKGAEEWGNVSAIWEAWHQERPEIHARVITPDGEVHILDSKTISDSPANEEDRDTYSDRHLIRAPLPAMAAGSVVEEEVTSREQAVLPDAGIVARDYFGRNVPVQHSRLSLDAPSALPVRYKSQLLPDLVTERKEENGRAKLVFENGPMEALEQADDNLPSDVPPYPNVTFSTGDSWQKLAQTYGKIVDEHVGDPALDALAKKIVSGKAGRDQQIEALVEYLNAQIRYTGIEFGESAVIPHAPSETLKRRYGDCKDKAVLLVALLRAAGIPSDVALLNVGQRYDVSAELPGFGMFDHAIVYVPGTPDFWIDATDDYARLGQLPNTDQGRLALVAAAATTSLVHTAVSTSTENASIENREFILADYGPARITETSQPHGSLESVYRRTYANLQDKKVQDDLTSYVQAHYLAEKLNHTERSDPRDFTRQFELTLESERAKRGLTDLTTAAAAIRLESFFTMLPEDLQTREPAKSENGDSPTKHEKKRTADYQLSEPFVREWRYRIVPPAGFQPKPLPKDTTVALGPAILTQEFSADHEGVVHAVIRFDMPKRRFSASEGTELRNKVAEIRATEPLLIYFQPVGQALLDQGKSGEAFLEYRSVIALRPSSAIPHLRMADALLSQGLGEAARNEARLAVKLEPTLAVAFKTLAEILESDVVSRRLYPGTDFGGAATAYRTAEKLDPADKTIPLNLAILLEYNRDGLRYGPGADLKGAVAEYRSLTPDELSSYGMQNNVSFALIYAKEFAEAKKTAEALNPQPKALILASSAALSGAQAALAKARNTVGNDDELKKLSLSAGDMLMNTRLYPPTADLLEAGASGDNAAHTLARVASFRKARLHESIVYPNDPAGVALNYHFTVMTSDTGVEALKGILSRNALLAVKNMDHDELQALLNQGTKFRHSLTRSGTSPDVVLDVATQTIDPKVDGNDATGYRVRLTGPGVNTTSVFVVKEDGAYKVLDDSTHLAPIGLEILDRLSSNDLAGARVLLDWIREDQHLAGGEDPFTGVAFPRFWTRGQDADAAQMKLAAAAILIQDIPTAAQGVSILEPALATLPSTTPDSVRFGVSLALIHGYQSIQAYDKVLPMLISLRKQYPDSRILFLYTSYALRRLNKIDEAEALAHQRLQKLPDDPDAIIGLEYLAEMRGDFAAAKVLAEKIQSSGTANAGNLNALAWLSLFTGKVTETDIQTAIRSEDMSNSWYTLHTLGSLYAEVGRTKEARDVFLKAMDLADLDEPDESFWYGFGRIAEQCGERDLAIAYYKKVTKPKFAVDLPTSTYQLAQKRLQFTNLPTGSNRVVPAHQ